MTPNKTKTIVKLSNTQKKVIDLARAHGRIYWYHFARNQVVAYAESRAQIRTTVHPTTIPKMIRAGILVRDIDPKNPMLVSYSLANTETE